MICPYNNRSATVIEVRSQSTNDTSNESKKGSVINKSLVVIAEQLNKQGYRIKKGYELKHSAIQNILANESTYRGNYKYGKEAEAKCTQKPILKPEK